MLNHKPVVCSTRGAPIRDLIECDHVGRPTLARERADGVATAILQQLQVGIARQDDVVARQCARPVSAGGSGRRQELGAQHRPVLPAEIAGEMLVRVPVSTTRLRTR